MSDAPETNGTGSSALFSTDAVDNAEVVPEDAPRGPESVWSTAANVGSAHSTVVEDEPSVDDMPSAHDVPVDDFDLIDEMPPVEGEIIDDDSEGWSGDTGGGVHDAGQHVWSEGVFSAEPAARAEDVIDERDVINTEPAWADPAWHEPTVGHERASALFASHPSDPVADAHREPASDPWDPWRVAEPSAAAPGADPASAGFSSASSESAGFSASSSAAGAGSAGAESAGAFSGSEFTSVPGDFPAAVARLDETDRERARVPLMISAALLGPSEAVYGVVTGQMLGRAAAVVVCQRRVLIINDRPWDPVIDIYQLGPGLEVRGRRDEDVAAMSFADEQTMSIVDDIHAVDAAVQLAELIRDAAAP